MFKILASLISSVGFELHVLIWIANNIIKWSQFRLRNKLEAKFPSTVNTPRTAIKDAPFINVLHRASSEEASGVCSLSESAAAPPGNMWAWTLAHILYRWRRRRRQARYIQSLPWRASLRHRLRACNGGMIVHFVRRVWYNWMVPNGMIVLLSQIISKALFNHKIVPSIMYFPRRFKNMQVKKHIWEVTFKLMHCLCLARGDRRKCDKL